MRRRLRLKGVEIVESPEREKRERERAATEHKRNNLIRRTIHGLKGLLSFVAGY